ncbi:hypothetical protein AALD22_16530 [Lachnospiraceae bacterium 56-18]|jgi:hypothetical protein
MKNDLSIIYEMLEQLDQIEDQRFLKQLYTLIKRHLEKKGKH